MKKASSQPGLIESFKSAFYNPEFYKRVPSFAFGKVMGYLLLLVTLGYVLMVGSGVYYVASHRTVIEQGIEAFKNAYPEELELTFDKGILTTNVAEPYFLPKEPIHWGDEGGPTINVQGPQYLVVIDTKTPFSQEQFKAYNVPVWLTKDTAYILKNPEDTGDNMEVLTYPNDKTVTIKKENVDAFLSEAWKNLFPVVLTIGVIAFIALAVFVFLFYCVYLLLATLPYFFASQIAGKKRSYPDCYRIAVYALTPAFLLEWLVMFCNFWFSLMVPPFLFTGVMLLTVLLNVKGEKK